MKGASIGYWLTGRAAIGGGINKADARRTAASKVPFFQESRLLLLELFGEQREIVCDGSLSLNACLRVVERDVVW